MPVKQNNGRKIDLESKVKLLNMISGKDNFYLAINGKAVKINLNDLFK